MSQGENDQLREQVADLQVRELDLWFPGQLTDSDREQINLRFQKLVDAVAAIRRHPLTNADEPATTFHAIVKDLR